MYGLSPVVGWLTDRIGVLAVLATGGVLLVSAAEIAATGAPNDRAQIFAGLFLLGLGWSFALVSGSSLVATGVDPERRVAAQGFTDLAMSALGAFAGIGAGLVLSIQSFGALSHLGAGASVVVVAADLFGHVARRAIPPVPAG